MYWLDVSTKIRTFFARFALTGLCLAWTPTKRFTCMMRRVVCRSSLASPFPITQSNHWLLVWLNLAPKSCNKFCGSLSYHCRTFINKYKFQAQCINFSRQGEELSFEERCSELSFKDLTTRSSNSWQIKWKIYYQDTTVMQTMKKTQALTISPRVEIRKLRKDNDIRFSSLR